MTKEELSKKTSSAPSVEQKGSYSAGFTAPGATVEEVKSTHSVLLSAAYFINSHCKDYNDDYMLCKRDNGDPAMCALEGRKVTRCVRDLFTKLAKDCGKEWDDHWKCLDGSNNHYFKCRSEEKLFNKCVFDKLGYKKIIPNAPDYEVPIHLRTDSERLYK